MNEKYTLDNLNQESVSVSRQSYIEYMGEQYPVGQVWRRAYMNDEECRKQIIEELPKPLVDAIFSIWDSE